MLRGLVHSALMFAIIAVTFVIFLIGPPTIRPAEAATLADWARNTETDMLQYRVYTCTVKGCTAVKGVTPQATVPQSAVGVRPSWNLPPDTEGALVVTAVDTSNNESAASVSVPFDTKPPAVPADVQTR